MFDESCPSDNQEEIKTTLSIVQEAFETKYLGLPTPEGRMKKGKFQSLQAQLSERLIQWGDNHLSSGGKES